MLIQPVYTEHLYIPNTKAGPQEVLLTGFTVLFGLNLIQSSGRILYQNIYINWCKILLTDVCEQQILNNHYYNKKDMFLKSNVHYIKLDQIVAL